MAGLPAGGVLGRSLPGVVGLSGTGGLCRGLSNTLPGVGGVSACVGSRCLTCGGEVGPTGEVGATGATDT